MPAGRAIKRKKSATIQRQSKRQRTLSRLEELPQPLLELILVSGNDIKDKKALRQTCKLFKQMLDDSCECIKLTASNENHQFLRKLISRMKHWRCLRAAVFVANSIHSTNLSRFFRLLPDKLTTLTLGGFCVNLEHLTGLRCLRTLNLLSGSYVEGIQHISGLICLNTKVYVGCVAHLAATLQELPVPSFYMVDSMDQLTNLDILEVWRRMPVDFFETHCKLPLKHLALNAGESLTFFENAAAWDLAPTTLTRLTLNDSYPTFPSMLPASITHLQLLNMKTGVIDTVAAALPGLRRLDIHSRCKRSDTQNLGKLTGLQTLGICRYNAVGVDLPLTRKRACSLLSGVAKAVERGLELIIIKEQNEMLGELHNLCFVKSLWAANTWI